MAKLFCINAGMKSIKNRLGDIVCMMEDDYVPANGMLNFDVVQVTGTVAEVQSKMTAKLPADKVVTDGDKMPAFEKYPFQIIDTKQSDPDLAIKFNAKVAEVI